jgi:uncharacterized membrane protein HdeD (DUF308 family)
MSGTADSTESRVIGIAVAVVGIAFVGLAALNYSTRDYLMGTWALTMAAAQVIFALQYLRWQERRPLWANIILGAVLATMLILGYLDLKDLQL